MPVYRPALAMGVSPATLLSSPIGVVAQPAETFVRMLKVLYTNNNTVLLFDLTYFW